MDQGGVKVGLLIGTCALLVLWGLGCSASSETCSLAAMRDQVSRIPVGQSASQAVTVGEYVSAAIGDSIGVDARGLAHLEFPDLVKVEIYRDSQLRVRDVSSQGEPLVDLYLTLGAIFCDAPPAARADRRIVVGTEWAQIQSTGTSFIVQYEPGAKVTRVGVLEGEVMVAGQDLGVIAAGGQIVRVDPGQPPTWPETDAALVLQWLDDLRAGRPLTMLTPTPAQVSITPTPTQTPSPGISVTISCEDYNMSSGYLTFRITNAAGGASIECVDATIVNRSESSSAVYYGPASSNSPFSSSPTSAILQDSLAPGETGYLRYKLAGNPAGVVCWTTFMLYTADDKGGVSLIKTVECTLPAPIPTRRPPTRRPPPTSTLPPPTRPPEPIGAP